MKKTVTTFILWGSFSLFPIIYAQNYNSIPASKNNINFLTGVGATYVTNNLTNTYGNSAGFNRDPFSFMMGIQGLNKLSETIKLGAEINFSHWLNETEKNKNHPLAINQDRGFCYHGLSFIGIAELKLSRIFSFQFGLGMYTTLLIDDQYGTRHGGSKPMSIFGPLAEIPINNTISIPLQLRFTMLEPVNGNFNTGYGFGGLMSITLNTGVVYKL